jgi:hypothetical protein
VSSLSLVREGTRLLVTRAAALLVAGHQLPVHVRVLALAPWLPVSLHACVDRIGRALRACGCVDRIGIRPSSSRCSPLFLFKKARYGCGAGVAGMRARVEYFLARQLISIGFGDIPHPCPRADSRTRILAHRVYCPRACGYFIPVAIFNRRSFKDQEM